MPDVDDRKATDLEEKKSGPCFDPYGISRELTGVDTVDFGSLETLANT